MRSLKGFLFAASAVALGTFAMPAGATVLYQSIPDLTVVPITDWCSTCSFETPSSYIGQAFSLASSATASSISFDVYNGAGY
jgi:hypothetical protein